MTNQQRTQAGYLIYDKLREIMPSHLAFTLSRRAVNDWTEADTIRFGTLGKEQFDEFIEQQKK